LKFRLRYVDGLRALAVLGVVAWHAATSTMDFHHNLLLRILGEGGHGVDLFFVISGFCLSYPTLAKMSAGVPFSFDCIAYLSRRAVRIFPPFWLSFVILFALVKIYLLSGYQVPWSAVSVPVSFTDALSQMTMWKESGDFFIRVYWTLPLEFRWYLIFPPLLWLWARGSKLAFGALMVVLVVAYRAVPVAHYMELAVLPCFMLGIVAAWIAIRVRPSAVVALAFMAIAVSTAVWLEPKGHLNFARPDQIWWHVACFSLVVAGGAVPWMRSVLSTRPLVAIGVASYSIYLVHAPFTMLYGLYGGTNLFLAIIVGVLPGLLFWRYCERPFVDGPLRDILIAHTEKWARRIFTPQKSRELISPAPGQAA
jgi:peptidoglycan/LPS O-acetylase OafA/YrhL